MKRQLHIDLDINETICLMQSINTDPRIIAFLERARDKYSKTEPSDQEAHEYPSPSPGYTGS